ncbi:helix-hairpin-helix domain-containing protein [Virgibacillus salexigens]|uniref:helix-hairpin-helix domain-containing protein n=1 Tax=Virgibacillus salexigens TaxID=61016 RepID=UPI001F1B9B90|nr:helix-hairpin-helix domain-containing protein [Virgibacillus salexigens]
MYFDRIKKILFLIGIPITIIILLIVMSDRSNNEDETQIIDKNEPKDPDDPLSDKATSNEALIDDQQMVVDVKGEVNKPGVYEMEEEDRVINAIEIAGGFTEEADQTQVNLAQRIQDEMVISVVKEGDTEAQTLSVNEKDKLHLNQATLEEIEALNGIGPTKAEAIVQYREENGLFKSVEDLLNVSGIGEKMLEAFQEDIQVP